MLFYIVTRATDRDARSRPPWAGSGRLARIEAGGRGGSDRDVNPEGGIRDAGLPARRPGFAGRRAAATFQPDPGPLAGGSPKMSEKREKWRKKGEMSEKREKWQKKGEVGKKQEKAMKAGKSKEKGPDGPKRPLMGLDDEFLLKKPEKGR